MISSAASTRRKRTVESFGSAHNCICVGILYGPIAPIAVLFEQLNDFLFCHSFHSSIFRASRRGINVRPRTLLALNDPSRIQRWIVLTDFLK